MKSIFLATATALAVFAASAPTASALEKGRKYCSAQQYVGPNAKFKFTGSYEKLRPVLLELISNHSDLELYILDEYNNVVVRGASDGFWEKIRWRPKKTGVYKIIIANPDKRKGSNFSLCFLGLPERIDKNKSKMAETTLPQQGATARLKRLFM